MPRQQLDQLDRDLLKEIISPGSVRYDVREPYSKIARRLSVDEETIRRRLSRLRQEGVIGRFVLFPNPRVIDRESALVYFEPKGTTPIGLEIPRLRLLDGVVSLVTVHGAGMLLDIFYQSKGALARQIALVESICNAKAAMLWKVPFPQYPSSMTRTDWAIILALRKEPRRKLTDLASELGVSSRTVNRRVQRLSDGKAFMLDLEFNIARISGMPSLLLVHYEDPVRKREADKVILARLQRLAYVDTSAQSHSVFAFHCENVSELDGVSRLVKGVNGVKDFKLGIIESRIYSHEWLDEEIQSRLNRFSC